MATAVAPKDGLRDPSAESFISDQSPFGLFHEGDEAERTVGTHQMKNEEKENDLHVSGISDCTKDTLSSEELVKLWLDKQQAFYRAEDRKYTDSNTCHIAFIH